MKTSGLENKTSKTLGRNIIIFLRKVSEVSFGKKTGGLCQKAEAGDRNHGFTLKATRSCSVNTPIFSLFLFVTEAGSSQSHSNAVPDKRDAMQISFVLSAITGCFPTGP